MGQALVPVTSQATVSLQGSTDIVVDLTHSVSLHGIQAVSYYANRAQEASPGYAGGIFQSMRTQNTSLADRQALHMTAIESTVRRLRDRIAATLVVHQPVGLTEAMAMAGNASDETAAELEHATDEFVASTMQQPEVMEEDELPDFGDSVDL